MRQTRSEVDQELEGGSKKDKISQMARKKKLCQPLPVPTLGKDEAAQWEQVKPVNGCILYHGRRSRKTKISQDSVCKVNAPSRRLLCGRYTCAKIRT